MANLSFGSITWRHDPTTFSVSGRRTPHYSKAQDGTVSFSGMGSVECRISGTGVFLGRDAWKDYLALEKQLDAAAPTALTHPRWGSCKAYLSELKMTEEPKNEYISYSFTFLRADAQGKVPQP